MGKISKKKILEDKNIDISELEKLWKTEKNQNTKTRLHAVILELKGYTREGIADILSTTRATVWRWLKRFNKYGIDGLRDKPKTGRPGKLSEKERENLRKDLEHSPREFGYPFDSWSTKLILRHIKEKYNVTYHQRYIQRFLYKLKVKLKIPRPKHYKSACDEERYEYTSALEEELKKTMATT